MTYIVSILDAGPILRRFPASKSQILQRSEYFVMVLDLHAALYLYVVQIARGFKRSIAF
jgi:hypothetical protein